MNTANVIDVTKIEPAFKHSRIFERLNQLSTGESLWIHNDHNPIPLLNQLAWERPGVFDWTYEVSGPRIWKIKIIKKEDFTQLSVGAIVAQDYRKAEVFKKLGIDFCCGGAQSVESACREVGISSSELAKMLDEATQAASQQWHQYNKWAPGFLADYIINTHHQYTREAGDVLLSIAEKVATHHGRKHPELSDLLQRLQSMLQELNDHMDAEEQGLFPKMHYLEDAQLEKQELQSLVQEMHQDHDHTGMDIQYLRTITDNYTLPEDACNSYHFLFEKLQEFENDLLQHIHLENNILFPKALELAKENAV